MACEWLVGGLWEPCGCFVGWLVGALWVFRRVFRGSFRVVSCGCEGTWSRGRLVSPLSDPGYPTPSQSVRCLVTCRNASDESSARVVALSGGASAQRTHGAAEGRKEASSRTRRNTTATSRRIRPKPSPFIRPDKTLSQHQLHRY